MRLAFICVSIVCIIVVLYVIGIKLQLRSIKKQLEQRSKEGSKTPVLLEMNDKDLKGMAVALNQTLKQEADLRISREIQEREFKSLIPNISHDLRTPLTVMKGYLQLLEKCEIDENGRDYLKICIRHSEELEKRVRQFFEYSYWVNQEEVVELTELNITNLVTDVMTDFIPVFEEKGITMRLEGEKIYKGLGEKELLKRVMQNLLKNCLQYAVGEVVVSIEEWKDSQLRICVANPVAADCRVDANKVFERFYVGNDERNQSAGLGLSIVKLLVEQMQGRVFSGMEDNVFYVGFFS